MQWLHPLVTITFPDGASVVYGPVRPEHAARLAELRQRVEAWMRAAGDEGLTHAVPRLLTDPRRAEPPQPAKAAKSPAKR